MDKKFRLNFFVLLAIFFPGIWSELSDDCAEEIKIGLCFASFERFGYNSTSGRCQKFTYGGCGSNKNNFETLSACQESCEEICSQERAIGLCRAYFPVFGYDAEVGKCVKYIYGGCNGTGNMFSSAEKCQKVCEQSD